MTYTDKCEICTNTITSTDALHWTHPHSDDEYCGTGDGSTAYPASGMAGYLAIYRKAHQ